MALTDFVLGTYLSAESAKGFVNLYSKLTAQDTLDTTSYVGSVQNGAKNGVNFGQIIGWRKTKNLVKIKLRVPISQNLGLSSVSEVWADASQVSPYAPPLDETALKFYYSTGNGVRLRSTPTLVSLSNVVGSANKGALLGKSDGYTDNNFVRIYATTLNGNYKLDAKGQKVSFYVHKDYVTTVNPAVTSTTTNAPDEGNASPVLNNSSTTDIGGTDNSATSPSIGIVIAIGLGIMAFAVAVFNNVKKRAKKTKP